MTCTAVVSFLSGVGLGPQMHALQTVEQPHEQGAPRPHEAPQLAL